MIFNLKLIREYNTGIYIEGSSVTKLMRNTSKSYAHSEYVFRDVFFHVQFFIHKTPNLKNTVCVY